MPNIVAHYVCGKLVANKLKISSNDYLKGCLYPDYVDKKRHYRVPGKRFETPDMDKFMEEEKIENTLFKIGFLTHLMLDKLFLDDFVMNNIYPKIDGYVNIFENDKIYRDYTNMSRNLLSHYHLGLNEIDTLMLKERKYIDIQKYKNDINTIRKNDSEDLKYIDLDSFIIFLNDSANKIYTYIMQENILKELKN